MTVPGRCWADQEASCPFVCTAACTSARSWLSCAYICGHLLAQLPEGDHAVPNENLNTSLRGSETARKLSQNHMHAVMGTCNRHPQYLSIKAEYELLRLFLQTCKAHGPRCKSKPDMCMFRRKFDS